MRTLQTTVLSLLAVGCSDAAIKTVNAEPTAIINSHTDGREFLEEASTTLFGTVADSNHSSADLLVNWAVNSEVICKDLVPNDDGYTECDVVLNEGTANIVLAVRDPDNASGNDTVTITIVSANEPPSITGVRISPEPAIAGALLTCTYSGFSDPNGDEDFSTYTWTLNGAAAGSGPTFSEDTIAGDEVVCTVTPSDGVDDGDPVNDTIIISNTAPIIESVAISPNPATTTDALGCSYSGFFDRDGHDDASTYAWTINGVAASTTSSLLNGYVNGDEVTCTVTPNDGTDDGAPLSDSIVISNTLPTIESVTISPETPTAADTLTCSYTGFNDLDEESDQSTYAWQVDGTDAGTGSTLSGAFVGGNVVTCTVTPNDGTDDGDPVSASVPVLNSAPEVTSVDITPDTDITTGTTLTCEATGTDIDGDEFEIAYAWTIGEETASGEENTLILDPSTASPGDVVTCLATLTDTSGASTSDEASVTVGNTVPVIDSVEVVPSSDVTTTTVLTCSATASDSDAEVPTLNYAWDIDSVEAGTSDTLDLSTVGAVTGETVTCTVTATDPSGATSDPGTDSVVIENTLPVIDSVTLDPNPVRTNDVLTAITTASDADGDEVLLIHEWYVNGTPAGDASDTLDGVSHFDKSDTVYVVVTPVEWFPGTETTGAEGLSVTSETIDVSNTPPSIDTVAISPDTAIETDALSCEYTGYTDADGDEDASTYAWTINGEDAGSDPTLSGGYLADDEVTCTVTPNDGSDEGIDVSATIVIGSDSECLSLRFDGVDDSVVVPASADFVATETALTFESWVNWDGDTDQAWYPIATQGWGDSDTARFFLAVAGLEGPSCSGPLEPGDLHVEIHTEFSFGPCFSSDIPLEAETWHHVAVVFDSGDARIYVDGIERGSDSVPDSTLHDATSSAVMLGRMDAGGGFIFKGALSSARYSSISRYDTEFTPTWPLEADDDTLGLWLLDDGGDIAFDSSSLAHDGDILDGTWDEDCPDVASDCLDGDTFSAPFAGDTYGDGLDSDCDEMDCEAGYVGDVYYAVCRESAEGSDLSTTWSDANDVCIAHGYDGLAMVVDATENSGLRDLVLDAGGWDDIWIGLSDPEDDGIWTWMDGTEMSFEDWGSGEPSAGEDNCVEIYAINDWTWNDRTCSETFPFVCEIR